MENKQPFRSGFVAILGRPNVGKSSIMNRFVGEKVAIVSNHPQTTRSRLLGVATHADWQIVFVDTPGLHKPRTKLGQYMVKAANDAREGVDAVLCVVDGQFIGAGDRAILEDVAKMSCPKFLAVNKIDLCEPEKLMPQLQKLNDLGFDQIVCVSARRGDNLDELLSMLVSAMPEGPKYFPDDMMTDQPERVLARRGAARRGRGDALHQGNAAGADGDPRQHLLRARLAQVHHHRPAGRDAGQDRLRGPQGHRKAAEHARVAQIVGEGARGLAQPRRRPARAGLRGRVDAHADHRRPGAAPRRLRRL